MDGFEESVLVVGWEVNWVFTSCLKELDYLCINILNCALQSIYCIYCQYRFSQIKHKAILVQALHEYYLHTFSYDLLSTLSTYGFAPFVDKSLKKNQGTPNSTRKTSSKIMQTRSRPPLDCL